MNDFHNKKTPCFRAFFGHWSEFDTIEGKNEDKEHRMLSRLFASVQNVLKFVVLQRISCLKICEIMIDIIIKILYD